MPTYSYRCESCKAEHEISHKITEEPLKICPSCQKATLKRGPGGGIGLSFQGAGFYINDYAKGDAAPPAEEKSTPCCPCGKNKCDSN